LLEKVLDINVYTDVRCKLQPETLNDIYNVHLLYTYVHAYVNYQKPFHSSLTHKQLPHMSANIEQSFSPTLMVIRHKILKNIQQPYNFFVRSAMQYNLKIQGFGSVMLCCSMTSRVTTQPSTTVSHPRTLIFSAAPL
jgi:hypothetical protein